MELPGVKSNPLLSKAKEGIELARAKKVDVVLAVGGGSVIDTAKTIAAGAKADHDPWEFFVYTKLVKEALPVLVVLTLSASASEMNAAAVITKDETCQKFSVRSPLIQPKTSILDPEVLFTLTPSYTAYSAVDIITHMLEGYFTNTETGESPLQDRMIYAFMRTLMEATEKSLANPKDYDARANFMWSGTLAFNGLTTAGMGIVGFPVHMIEHSLSALYDIAHGAGLSIMLARLDGVVCEKEPGAIRTAGKGILPGCRGRRREGRRRGHREAQSLVQRREEPRVPERRRHPRGRHRKDRRQRRPARPDMEAEGLHERGDRGGPEPLPIKTGLLEFGYSGFGIFAIWRFTQTLIHSDTQALFFMTGIILAGGKASRLGGINKAFIEIGGERLIDRTMRVYRALFEEIIISTNSPLEYLEFDARIVTDIHRGKGPLGGIHAGLLHATCEHAFVSACDMPYLSEAFIGHMMAQADRLRPGGSRHGQRLRIAACHLLPQMSSLHRIADREWRVEGFPPVQEVQDPRDPR